jgi:xanthine/CO dehydrogenase XdhC/CoxF family maturation factor
MPCSIGLPIGSQTPYEIAVSILAELIGLRHQDRKQDS